MLYKLIIRKIRLYQRGFIEKFTLISSLEELKGLNKYMDYNNDNIILYGKDKDNILIVYNKKD